MLIVHWTLESLNRLIRCVSLRLSFLAIILELEPLSKAKHTQVAQVELMFIKIKDAFRQTASVIFNICWIGDSAHESWLYVYIICSHISL